MKRSEVNAAIKWAKKLLKNNNISLPVFADWKKEDWVRNYGVTEMIRKTMLGWDVTDFGLNDFKRIGGVLFTLRNGDQKDKSIGVPYAEK